MKKSATGTQDEVMKLKKFDYFGERALLNDAPRAASVKATTPMKLLQITKKHFEEVLGSLDEIIDNHRRKREEAARRAYLQRQAEGLIDSTAHEFQPVAKTAQFSVSDIYVVKRTAKLDENASETMKTADFDNQRLTVRVVSKKKATDDKLRGRVMAEIKLFGDLIPSSFCPSLLATFSDRSRMYAVMGCVAIAELGAVWNNNKLIDVENGEATVRFYIAALILALMHLHRQEIVARMISMESIMLDGKGYPLLIDFTLGKKLTDCGGKTYTLCGVAEYNAPEQVQKAGHGTSPDWWAVGILAYELLFDATPFAPKKGEQPAPSPEAHPADDGRRPSDAAAKGATELRRPSIARLLVTTGGGELEHDMMTYKNIMAYASEAEPKIEYPQGDKAPSKKVKELIEDLLDPKPDVRLGCRSNESFDDFQVHEFFEGFNFVSLEDGSLPAPWKADCEAKCSEMMKSTGTGPNGKKLEFETSTYVGDNRWCDDWDFTCTVGSTVEESDNAKMGTVLPSAVRRKSISNKGAS